MKISPVLRGFGYGTVLTASTNFAIWYFFGKDVDSSQQSDGSPRINLPQRKLFSKEETLEDTNRLDILRKVLKYGTPDIGPEYRIYEGHVLCYNQERKIPRWTAEYLTKDNIKGSANRRRSHFKPDADVEKKFSADNDDYHRSGWSRGHMIPAGDLKYSQKAMDDSFKLTNIVPQDYDNNSGFWNRFEIFCRDLTSVFDEVRIISGPVFIPEFENGKKWLKNEVIGKNEVHVPTHLYKVIIAENTGSMKKAVASFIVPNEKIHSKTGLSNFQVELDDLETRLGIRMLPGLSKSDTTDLCTKQECRLKTQAELDRYYMSYKLQRARTPDELEAAWNEVAKKKRHSDKVLIDVYNKRLSEIGDRQKLRRNEF